jgi:hypothetical protein
MAIETLWPVLPWMIPIALVMVGELTLIVASAVVLILQTDVAGRVDRSIRIWAAGLGKHWKSEYPASPLR